MNSCNIPRKFTTIQSIGYIFILDRNNLKIKSISQNVTDHLKLDKDQLFNLDNFCKLLREDTEKTIFNYLLFKTDRKTTRIVLFSNNIEYYCHSYKSNDYIILELEEKKETAYLPFDIIRKLKYSLKSSNFSEKILITIIKNITNMDRVMLYVFNSDWSGKVTEEESHYSTKFKDIYFHETDIPVYVRGLFCKNPIRYIYDSHETGFKLLNSKDMNIDIVDSRNSEIIHTNASHRKYLELLNCRTSFSLAITIEHHLHALIICHNKTPLYISPFIRQQCYNFVSLYSEYLTNKKNFDQKYIDQYIHDLYKFSSVFNFVSSDETRGIFLNVINEIKELCGAQELIYQFNNNVQTPECYIKYIISKNIRSVKDTVQSNDTHKLFKDLFNIQNNEMENGSIIIIKIDENQWFSMFKKSKVKRIKWAGHNYTTIHDGISFPRSNMDFVEENYTETEPFSLTEKNLRYIKEFLLYFCNKLDNKNNFTEYFLNHKVSEQQQFISGILHEIRNPINGLVGLFDILNSNKQFDQDIINDGISTCNLLQDLATNIINVSKYTHNETINYGDIDWKSIIEETVNIYKYIKKSEVQINSYIDKNIPLIISDITKLKQILNNLISNAVKFTKLGSINIRVSLMNQIDKVSWVQISVQDTGCGIPSEQQIRLFKSFEQINNNFIHSSGLGLIICSQIVKLLNGTINFHSETGIGTTFNVIIPMINKEDNSKNNKRQKLTEKHKLFFLIVDDNDINRKVLEYRLSEHKVISVSNGKDAIEIVKREQNDIDIILMDLQMPGMDGIETLSIIKEVTDYKNRVIAVTGHSFDSNYFRTRGFDDYIIKPVLKQNIDTIIENYIQFKDK